MTRMNRLLATAASGMAFAVLASAASAAPVLSFDPFEAGFQNYTMTAAGGGDATLDPAVQPSATSPVSIAWGTPTNLLGNNPGLLQSEYIFSFMTPPSVDLAGGDSAAFAIGSFTHENWTLLNPGVNGGAKHLLTTDLVLNFKAKVDGFSPVPGDDYSITVSIAHDETPNTPACPLCPDNVNFVSITGSTSANFQLGTDFYSVFITGFFADAGLTVPLGPTFVTQEASTNVAYLGALVLRESRSTEVPVPAALPLLATAMGVVGFAGWRRRRAA
mgnify:CR=1 FL=1